MSTDTTNNHTEEDERTQRYENVKLVPTGEKLARCHGTFMVFNLLRSVIQRYCNILIFRTSPTKIYANAGEEQFAPSAWKSFLALDPPKQKEVMQEAVRAILLIARRLEHSEGIAPHLIEKITIETENKSSHYSIHLWGKRTLKEDLQLLDTLFSETVVS